jgi:PAS domain S-box-containing protein
MAASPPSAADWAAQAAALAAAEAQVVALQQQLAELAGPATPALVSVPAPELARLRLLARLPAHIPHPVLLLVGTGEVLYANLAAGQLLQALATEAPADGRAPLLALVQAAQRTAGPYEQELVLAGQYYACTAVASTAPDGAVLHLTNITARQQTEQRLIRQQAFYESVLEQIPVAVSVFDDEQRYLFTNPVVEPNPPTRAWMIGRTQEEAGRYRQRAPAIIQQRLIAFAEARREQREVVWEETNSGWTGKQHFLVRLRPVAGPDGTRWFMGSAFDVTELKQVQNTVARQREFYESVLNLLPVDVVVFDAERRLLFINPSAAPDPLVRQRMIGKTYADFGELNPHVPEEIQEKRRQYFDLAARTQQDITWEELLTDPQMQMQRPKMLLRHARPVLNADGTLRLMVGAGIDITARYVAENLQQQAQELLQEQQAFVRLIVDNLPNVLYVAEADGQISFINKDYNQQSALDADEPCDPAAAACRQLISQLRRWDKQVLASLLPITEELPLVVSTGEIHSFQVHKRPLHRANGQVAVLTIGTDITPLKQARQAVEHRERRYHDLVYYSQALICTHSLDGVLLSVNPATERLLGVPAAQLVGHHISEVLPPEYHGQLQDYLNGPPPSPSHYQSVAVRNQAGEKRYLRYYILRVVEEGYPTYVVASGYDVTEGVLAQRALQLAKHAAEEDARAKELFLARMSHEIRTPLNGVLGMAALLKKTSLTSAQQEYLNTMQHAGVHLLALVNDVLDMAKITTQLLELDHAPFDLALALQGAGQTVAALAEQKGLALVVEPLPLASPRVLGDAYRLHQLLLNLLSNAIKFTDAGHVRLGTTLVRETPDALTIRFWVEDTGVGIAPGQQEHIFEAFAQASAETSSRFGGTGLGLSISQQLVQQMGGVLRLCSEPGVGTTFAFQLTLPRVGSAPGQQPVPAASSYEELRDLRVLLAEDNLVNQWIAVVVLEHWGVRVQAVGNGLDALAHLSEEPYDVAILDINMPGLSGLEVTSAIRRHPDAVRASIPIIALTANAFENDRAGYLAAGMNACLTKPYEEADLCELLVQLAVGTAR